MKAKEIPNDRYSPDTQAFVLDEREFPTELDAIKYLVDNAFRLKEAVEYLDGLKSRAS